MKSELVKIASKADSLTEKMREIINKDHDLSRKWCNESYNHDDIFKEMQSIHSDYEDCKVQLHEILTSLIFNIRNVLPRETDYLQLYLPSLAGAGEINPYDFGAIRLLVPLIRDKVFDYVNSLLSEESSKETKSVFISHSSKDIERIRSFIDNILILGCGLHTEQIFCSSIDSTGINSGHNIREQLKSQIKNCDMVLFMISNNYVRSSICLNEMGAAWVLDKDAKPLLFPGSDYSKMGWLYEISKGIELNQEESLDEFRDVIINTFKISRVSKTSDWTYRKHKFIESLLY